ncbi:MAG: type II 3-dehydroquinate dehydratase [Clostridia bacterium]|nr:type II 3-dehydroquinate dehydratase [Clostridia bacterium]
MKILVINGPNLDMLGKRNPEVYGKNTLADLENEISEYIKGRAEAEFFQSACEGEIVKKLNDAYNNADGVIINAGAYTHYSYAIRDALEILEIPKIEVHISDIHKRESFRHISVIEDVCDMQIAGYGFKGYLMAADEILERIKNEI